MDQDGNKLQLPEGGKWIRANKVDHRDIHQLYINRVPAALWAVRYKQGNHTYLWTQVVTSLEQARADFQEIKADKAESHGERLAAHKAAQELAKAQSAHAQDA